MTLPQTIYEAITESISYQPIKRQCFFYIKTSPLIYSANQLTGFYIMENVSIEWCNIKVLISYLAVATDRNKTDF